MSEATFLFCSHRALHRPTLRFAEILAKTYELDGHVIAPVRYCDSPVWEASGKLTREDFEITSTSLEIHFLPARNGDVERFGFEDKSFRQALGKIRPTHVYVHAEFWQGIARNFLWHYRFQKTPRIIAHIEVNHVNGAAPLLSLKWPVLSRTRLLQKLLWSRLDGVSACATASMECARRIGLPESVPVVVNYLPVFGPEEAAGEGIALPWQREGAFTVGFAGSLTEQKGWKILLAAVERLPNKFKLIIAGDGEQRDQLNVLLHKPSFYGRAYCAGLLRHNRLLATYPLFDVFVLPSITTPHSVEQFGAVLAEAMGCGVPVIGSDSGAIPETVGGAGLIVPEGDPDALARAIIRTSEDEELRRRAIARGLERFHTHYSCEAYARSVGRLLGISGA